VTRLLSGAALSLLAFATVWFAPPWLLLVAAEFLLLLALREFASLARESGLPIPTVVAGGAAALTSIGMAAAGGPVAGVRLSARLDAILVTAVIALSTVTMARWRGERDAMARAAVAIFPALYLGVPIGAMVAIRTARGPAALLLLILTVAGSDTAQYYVGRAVGRRPLAPAISPKKTLEGAVGGLGAVPRGLRLLLGLAVALLGIAGDLFESMLKRSAGVKDSSTLIPGHGGVLDRIDALLFAAPVYWIVLTSV
jgi:phosphatidate cytidylyltransferase